MPQTGRSLRVHSTNSVSKEEGGAHWRNTNAGLRCDGTEGRKSLVSQKISLSFSVIDSCPLCLCKALLSSALQTFD